MTTTSPAASQADSTDHVPPIVAAASASPGRRRPTWATIAVAAVLVFTALAFARTALLSPVHFDGALNLQVAQNIAQGDGWTRDYGGVRAFPHEVQTGGAFIVGEAAAIKVLGENQLAYQLGSVVCAWLLLGAVAWSVRDNKLAMALAPPLVLIGLPRLGLYGMGGLGEVPVTALGFLAVVLIASIANGSRRPYLAAGVACLAVGTAVTVKTIAIAWVPVVLIGLVLAAIVRPELSKARLAAVVSSLAVPIGLFELYRLQALGWSWSLYRSYWTDQRGRIEEQAGLQDEQARGLAKAARHLELLAAETEMREVALAVFLVLPFIVLAALLIVHRRSLRSWLSNRLVFLSVLLASVSGLYLVWWFFVTTTRKAWLRRVYIGFASVELLYAVLIVLLIVLAGTGLRRRASYATAGALLVVALIALFPVMRRDTRVLADSDRGLDQWEAAADAVAAGAGEHRYFAVHWYAAPVVSLMADVPFHDLSRFDHCTLNPETDIYVWDAYAQSAFPEPHTQGGKLRVVEQIADYPGAAALYRIEPSPEFCSR